MIVDTSVLLPFLTGGDSPEVRYFEASIRADRPWFLTGFSIQEVLQGARDEREWKRLLRHLEEQPLSPLIDSARSHIAAARIYYDCRRRGLTVRSVVDCLIAQIALEHDLPLLHDDRDYAAIALVRPLKMVDLGDG